MHQICSHWKKEVIIGITIRIHLPIKKCLRHTNNQWSTYDSTVCLLDTPDSLFTVLTCTGWNIEYEQANTSSCFRDIIRLALLLRFSMIKTPHYNTVPRPRQSFLVERLTQQIFYLESSSKERNNEQETPGIRLFYFPVLSYTGEDGKIANLKLNF